MDCSPPGFPSLGFSRQEHWSGLPFPSPMHESEKWKWSHSVVSDSSDPMDYSLPGSSIHGIFQAKVLEWDAIAFSAHPGYPASITGQGIKISFHATTHYCLTKTHFLWPSFTLPIGFHDILPSAPSIICYPTLLKLAPAASLYCSSTVLTSYMPELIFIKRINRQNFTDHKDQVAPRGLSLFLQRYA